MPVPMADKANAAGPARIRALNRKAVLSYIRKNGPISRSGLIPALGLSAAAVSSVTNELVEGGFLRPAEAKIASDFTPRGRPKSPLELNPDAVYAIGLRLHPVDRQCRIQRAWINYAGQIERLPTQVFSDYHTIDGVIDAILAALSSVEQSVPDRHKILAASIAIPGPIRGNEVLIAPSLRAIEGRSFAPAIAHQANYPISLHNDVNLAVLSELHLQPRLKHLNFSYLYIGLGVGAGFGLGGNLWSGNGWAGEVGHLRIMRNGDEPPRSFEEMLSTDGAFVDELDRLGLAQDNLDGIAQADTQDILRRLLDDLEILHVPLTFEEVSDPHLRLGRGHFDRRMTHHLRVADARQQVCYWISYWHVLPVLLPTRLADAGKVPLQRELTEADSA